MGLHEWIMIVVVVLAATVAAVEIRKSKRPRPEQSIEDRAIHGVTSRPGVTRSRHVLLVGHTAVTRVSIRRALEQYMGVTEARSTADGLDRLDEVTGPDVDVTVVVDLTGAQDTTGHFLADVLAVERDHPARLLVVTSEPGQYPPPALQEVQIEYLPQPQSVPTLLAAIRREPEPTL